MRIEVSDNGFVYISGNYVTANFIDMLSHRLGYVINKEVSKSDSNSEIGYMIVVSRFGYQNIKLTVNPLKYKSKKSFHRYFLKVCYMIDDKLLVKYGC